MIPLAPELPAGAIPLRAVVITEYLDDDGAECTVYRITGDVTTRQMLSMMQIAQLMASHPVVLDGRPDGDE